MIDIPKSCLGIQRCWMRKRRACWVCPRNSNSITTCSWEMTRSSPANHLPASGQKPTSWECLLLAQSGHSRILAKMLRANRQHQLLRWPARSERAIWRRQCIKKIRRRPRNTLSAAAPCFELEPAILVSHQLNRSPALRGWRFTAENEQNARRNKYLPPFLWQQGQRPGGFATPRRHSRPNTK